MLKSSAAGHSSTPLELSNNSPSWIRMRAMQLVSNELTRHHTEGVARQMLRRLRLQLRGGQPLSGDVFPGRAICAR